MNIFVKYCLERYNASYNDNIVLVGSPIMPDEFELGQSYVLINVHTDRESSDSIPEQVLCDTENRVKKVIYESVYENHQHIMHCFLCEFEGQSGKYYKIEQNEFDAWDTDNDRPNPIYVLYKFEDRIGFSIQR